MATYVNDLRLTEIATGDETGDWGDITNTNLELVAEAFSFGTEAITTNADTHTTTIADGATDPGRSIFLKYTGTLDSACTITIGPNTVSKLWFIENGTSGSQNIIISSGSGANITIPPGDTKAVYSDGAGSGAAMVDAFASLSVVDLKVQDDLTVTDDITVGGDIDLAGDIVTTSNATLDLAPNGTGTVVVRGNTNSGAIVFNCESNSHGQKVFGQPHSASVTNTLMLPAGANSTLVSLVSADTLTNKTLTAPTLTGTSTVASLDISGDIDVDGTTNLDIVDIDGAVNIAADTTIASTNKIIFNDASQFIHAPSATVLDLAATDEIELTATLVDVVGNFTNSGTIVSAGVLTANAGVVVDEMTLDGDTLTATDTFTIDAAADIIIDAGGGDILFKDDGTESGRIVSRIAGELGFNSEVNDADIKFKGKDGGSTITALTLDMSEAGAATFNDKITAVGTSVFTNLDISGDVDVDGTLETDALTVAGVAAKVAGKETIYIPATAMYPSTTNGCAALAQVETTALRPDLMALDFATGADEFAQFSIAFPKSWNEGTVTFQPFWTVTGTNTGTVAWGLSGISVSSDGSINTAFGTTVVCTALAFSGTSNDLMVSVESGAVTIAGSPAANDMCFFQVSRDVSADNQSGDARLLGIKVFFTTDAANDA